MELYQWVRWSSQANGTAKEKVGQIVAVVPAGRPFHLTVQKLIDDGVVFRKFTGPGLQRSHDSYAVLVPPENKGKGQLYWPLVSKLGMTDAPKDLAGSEWIRTPR